MFSSGCAKDSPVVLGKPELVSIESNLPSFHRRLHADVVRSPGRASHRIGLYLKPQSKKQVWHKTQRSRGRERLLLVFYSAVTHLSLLQSLLLQVNILTFTLPCYPTSPSWCLSVHVLHPFKILLCEPPGAATALVWLAHTETCAVGP